MREIWTHPEKPGWDDVVPKPIERKWSKFYEEMSEIENLKFRRGLKIEGVEGLPTLVIFGDGSEKAYGAVAYIRWKIEERYICILVAAKNRIAPVKKIDVVRLELCGAVIGTRLRTYIEKETDFKFEKIYHITDSEIVRAMIRKKSYGFNTFAANRIGEINRATKEDEWYCIESPLNVADLVTRGCKISELGADSTWQKGPPFLTGRMANKTDQGRHQFTRSKKVSQICRNHRYQFERKRTH